MHHACGLWFGLFWKPAVMGIKSTQVLGGGKALNGITLHISVWTTGFSSYHSMSSRQTLSDCKQLPLPPQPSIIHWGSASVFTFEAGDRGHSAWESAGTPWCTVWITLEETNHWLKTASLRKFNRNISLHTKNIINRLQKKKGHI